MAVQSVSNLDPLVSKSRSIDSYHLVPLLGDWPSFGTRGPLYNRLAAALRSLILDARIPLGVRMPAERPLASALSVSRTTISAAYSLLREEGFIESRRGGGSWSTLPAGRGRRGAPWGPAIPEGSEWLDLAVAAPPGDEKIMVALASASALLPRYLTDHGYDSRGVAILREAVAERYASRGLPTSPEQIFITSGAQQAIDLTVRALAEPLDPVLIESPTYPGALDVLTRNHSRVIAVGISDSVTALGTAIRQVLPRLAYLIPDFHNPTGRLLDSASRAFVVEAAEASGSRLVVDETFVELGLDNSDLPPPLASYGRGDTVISVGSMSKAFWGGLRIGWVRADRTIVAHLVQARATLDMASPILGQLLAAQLLSNPSDLLNSRREMLRIQRDALIAALGTHLPGWQFQVPPGGLSLWANLGEPISTALVTAAESYQLRLAAGPRFGSAGTLENFIRLPFSLPPKDLALAVERLERAVSHLHLGTRSLSSTRGTVV